jgi:hypothetical protein
VLALVLASLVGAGLAVAAANNGPAKPKLPGGDAGTSLAAAGQAEQRFYDKHNRYTASILDLTPVGYRPTKGVTLTVLHADGGTYCLSASQGSAVYYLSSADLLISRTPCS